MSERLTSLRFRQNAAEAVLNPALRQALRTSTDLFAIKRAQGMESVPMEAWRDAASAIRMQVLDNLPAYLDRFSAKASRAGAMVHRAKDGQSARDIVFNILKDHNVRKIVKAKSMVTEEIHLNAYLEARGMEVVETDLGEYIVQIAGETPSHILAPAIHKSRQEVGQLFAEKLGVDYSDDPTVLVRIARNVSEKKISLRGCGNYRGQLCRCGLRQSGHLHE